jgi:hypothetical protein
MYRQVKVVVLSCLFVFCTTVTVPVAAAGSARDGGDIPSIARLLKHVKKFIVSIFDDADTMTVPKP